ncbi:MAG: 4Fe-4S binding protein [Chloroflexi bacterium]|nr:4Fe-4S binding protein [Chloroflexota bacterium]
MQAFYGFKDGTGDWFLAVDTDNCNGCGKCEEACPAHIIEIADDEFDPFREEQVARVKGEERNKLRYSCAPCRPGYGDAPTPCAASCQGNAITHSEGWKLVYGR